MSASWTRTAEPAREPITVADAALHARITQLEGESSLDGFIRAARDECEAYMNRGLFTQTWKLELSDFARVMPLPMAAPLQSVTTVQYYDVNGTLQTLSSTFYTVNTTARPGRVERAADQAWPSLQADKAGARVVITYVVGWTDPELIPERIRQGIRQYVAYLDLDREGLENAEVARQAAYRCWSDQVAWIEPSCAPVG